MVKRATLAILFLCALGTGAPAAGRTVRGGLDATAAARPGDSGDELVRALERARMLRRAGLFGRGEALLIRESLNPAIDANARTQITAELANVRTIRQQLLRLDSIEGQMKAGLVASAASQLASLAPEVSDPRVRTRLVAVSREIEKRRNDPLRTLYDWAWTGLPLIFLVLFILGLRWLMERGSRHKVDANWSGKPWFPRKPQKWRLTEVADSTAREAKSLIAHYFSKWSRSKSTPLTSGLLLMEASAVPAFPSLDPQADQFDISSELEATEITIGGVNVAGVIRILPKLWRWLTPQPTAIKGFVYLNTNGDICARLTTRHGEHKKNVVIVSVSAIANGSDEAAAQQVAEEVTFKMLYALSSGEVEVGTAADDLRDGLKALRSYLTGIQAEDNSSPWIQLEMARATFERVRMFEPNSVEAHLYEGIALDLLERHEDAIAHFDYAKQLTAGATDKEAKKRNDQAIYNGAVANLRNLYGLEAVDEAIRRLEEFIGENPNLLKRPILALAYATLADAFANRTIHWDKLKSKETKVRTSAKDDTKLLAAINLHKEKIDNCITPVEDALNTSNLAAKPEWGKDTERQVRWAISNAWADYYLYAATSLVKLDVSTTAKFKNLGDIKESPEFKDNIKEAIAALRRCEMLLPPGVETLSNLGTAYMTRALPSDLPVARQYFQRAIALNPHYEYAYYRLAQTWEIDQWREKVIATLRACPVPPRIGKFRDMFDRYYVEPKFEYAADAQPAPAGPQPGPAGGNPASAPAHNP